MIARFIRFYILVGVATAAVIAANVKVALTLSDFLTVCALWPLVWLTGLIFALVAR